MRLRNTKYDYRVMGSVWVLFLLSAHTRPIYPTHGKIKIIFFSIMMLNQFTVLLNNNDVRPITAELVETEIP